mmetsp:Transcript_11117/g.14534  ORF Transcript_11117/g.14534 Transcript_11117/m.14534 type:complete len:445 (-) Transcript_11117:1075-2409(-)
MKCFCSRNAFVVTFWIRHCLSLRMGDTLENGLEVPFISFGLSNNDVLHQVSSALQVHKENIECSLRNMVQSYWIAREAELMLHGKISDTSLSSRIEKRIERLGTLLDEDYLHMETSLLAPVNLTLALPNPTTDKVSTYGEILEHEISSYDSILNVVAHVVRDWSSVGERRHYQWCLIQLLSLYNERAGVKILIPGAGLGRLAFDIAREGFFVEANECSVVMATASYNIISGKATGTLHPWCYDSFLNEIKSEARYDSLNYPDISPPESFHAPPTNLSYTVGDFVSSYSSSSRYRSFDSVVTCFFIDTASNFYEYVSVIDHVLKDGGMWINYGPLQWHKNALITPSSDEMFETLKDFGFEIRKWDVDRRFLNYRNFEEDIPRYTKTEGYNSLMFVVMKSSTNRGDRMPTKNLNEIIALTKVAVRKLVAGGATYSPSFPSNVTLKM